MASMPSNADAARHLTGRPAFRGLALATDTITGAFFLGLSGAVFAWGQDGLAFALGLGAGYLLLQLLVAPQLPRGEAASVPEFFAERYGGGAPRVLACAAVVTSMLLLLVAELMVAGLVAARLAGLDFGVGVAIAAAALLLCYVLRHTGGTRLVRGVVFAVMLAAFLAPVTLLSAEHYGLPIPQIAYSNALWQIQGLEETLLEQDLADPAVMKPMLGSFLALNPLNFLGLVLGLAAGMASLPHVLSRYFTTAGVHAARWTAVWALGFAALFLSAAPALAAFAKLALLGLIGDHTAFADLPAWMFTYGRLGLVEICGRAATDAGAVARACATLPDASAVLRLQDLTLDPDMIALAAPEITGLSPVVFGFLAAAGLAAALVSADGPLASIVRALWPQDRARHGRAGRAPGLERVAQCAIAAAAILIAAFASAARPAGFLTVATWAFTVAAAGLFPALVGGLWWRRASAPGATAAMLVGLAVCLHYLLATRFLAVGFFETWQSLSTAGPTARDAFAELKQAWLSAVPGEAKNAAWIALDAQAQAMANWWGIKPLAAALLALPAGIVALVVVSLAVPGAESGKA